MTQAFSETLQNLPKDDSLTLFRVSAELSFNSIVVTDARHSIIYANPAFCRMTGYSAEELAGQNPKILQGPMTEAVVIDQLRRDLKNDGYFSGSTINYRKNGK
ncbi:MAG: signaling protein, partial [Marinobacter sp. T13-3]